MKTCPSCQGSDVAFVGETIWELRCKQCGFTASGTASFPIKLTADSFEREQFVAFLNRIHSFTDTPPDWDRFVVTHYTCSEVEKARIALVRVYIDSESEDTTTSAEIRSHTINKLKVSLTKR